MKKIKIFKSVDEVSLEKKVNEYLEKCTERKDVVEKISYQTVQIHTQIQFSEHDTRILHSVLIEYRT
jgi:hypothetical protein